MLAMPSLSLFSMAVLALSSNYDEDEVIAIHYTKQVPALESFASQIEHTACEQELIDLIMSAYFDDFVLEIELEILASIHMAVFDHFCILAKNNRTRTGLFLLSSLLMCQNAKQRVEYFNSNVYNAFSKTHFKLFADEFNAYFKSIERMSDNITIDHDTFHHIFVGINENKQMLGVAAMADIIRSICYRMFHVYRLNLNEQILEDLMTIFGSNGDYLSATKLMETVLNDSSIDQHAMHQLIGLYHGSFKGAGLEVFQQVVQCAHSPHILHIMFVEIIPFSGVPPRTALSLLFGSDLTLLGSDELMMRNYFIKYHNNQDYEAAIKLLLYLDVQMCQSNVYLSHYIKLFEAADIEIYNKVYHRLYNLNDINYNIHRRHIEDLTLFTISEIMCKTFQIAPNINTHRIVCQFIFDPKYYGNYDELLMISYAETKNFPLAIQLVFDLNISLQQMYPHRVYYPFIQMFSGLNINEFNKVLNFLYLHFNYIDMQDKVDEMVLCLFNHIVPISNIEPNMITYRIWQKLIDLSSVYNRDSLRESFKQFAFIKNRFAVLPENHRIWRVMQRIRELELGKDTVGYRNYIRKVPVDQRIPGIHPQTPDPTEPLTKRTWDAKNRAWRRALHLYDNDFHDATNNTEDTDDVIVLSYSKVFVKP